MKTSIKHLGKALLFCALSWQATSASAEVLFQDDFESGGLAKTMGAAKWGSKTSVSVSSSQARGGKYSAQFNFVGNTSLAETADAFSELRFDLGAAKQELWIQYSLYVPTNYKHRNADGSDNNKLLRLWGVDYSDVEKIGFSTWPTSAGYSSAQADWSRNNGGIGPKGTGYASFIASSDLGKWMTIKVHVKAATATQNGSLKLWKNGQLVINNDGTMDSYWASNIHSYRYGYLMGWSNSGFTENTLMYIDDVVFATSESDLVGGVVSPPSAPMLQLQ